MDIRTSFETTASPEQVVAALTDFSERRPEIWKDSLDPDKFEAIDVGETTARVREGSKFPNVWALESYEWGPGHVRTEVQESNFCKPGSGVTYTVTEGVDGGSHVQIDWHREASNVKGRMIIGLMGIVGKKMLATSSKKSFDRYADTAGG